MFSFDKRPLTGSKAAIRVRQALQCKQARGTKRAAVKSDTGLAELYQREAGVPTLRTPLIGGAALFRPLLTSPQFKRAHRRIQTSFFVTALTLTLCSVLLGEGENKVLFLPLSFTIGSLTTQKESYV